MKVLGRGLFVLPVFLFVFLSVASAEVDSRAFFRQAVEAFNHQNFESAYHFYKLALEEEPSSLEARGGLVFSRINLGAESLESIETALQDGLARDARDYHALYSLAVLAELKNDMEAARTYYEAALAFVPEPAAIDLALLNLHLKYNPDAPAVFRYLEKLGREAPDSYLNFIGQARYYLTLAERENSLDGMASKLNLAARAAREAQTRRPFSIAPYYSLAYSAVMAGDLKYAKSLLTQAVALAPMDSLLHMILASVYMQEENFEEARQHFVIAKKSLTVLDRISGYDRSVESSLGIIKIQARVNPWVYQGAVFVILIFSVILHEVMHGWMAFRRGDQTARALGRLSLNPLVHLDWFGSVVLPLVLMTGHSPFLVGWAKPVPVNPENYKHPRRDDVLVSLAGPAVHVVLALMFAGALAGLGHYMTSQGYVTYGFGLLGHPTIITGGNGGAIGFTYAVNICKYGFAINMILAWFNLLPIPPLDGSHVLKALIPFPWVERLWGKVSRFGLVVVALLAVSGILGYLLAPVFMMLHLSLAIIARGYGLG